MSQYVELDDELVESARIAALSEGRSVEEQIEYWVRAGMQVSEKTNSELRYALFKKGELKMEEISEEEGNVFIERLLTEPSDYTFDPRVTGIVTIARNEEFDKPMELRPDGTAWLGFFDEKDNYKFVIEKQIPWPVVF